LSRLSLAFKSFFGLLFSGKLPEDVMLELNLTRRLKTPASTPKGEAPKPAAPQPQPSDGAVLMLALLQEEARFVDFLQEDIGPYTDDQVGAAVRDVHKGCRAVLERHLKLAPVVDGVEGTNTRLASVGLDVSDANSVKVVGNVPPGGKVEGGILRHRGWKVESIELPQRKTGQRVVAPAEIEVE